MYLFRCYEIHPDAKWGIGLTPGGVYLMEDKWLTWRVDYYLIAHGSTARSNFLKFARGIRLLPSAFHLTLRAFSSL